AVKHGVADRVEGGTIEIVAARRGTRLEITIENPRDPEAPPRRGQGLGLGNGRPRLAPPGPRAAGAGRGARAGAVRAARRPPGGGGGVPGVGAGREEPSRAAAPVGAPAARREGDDDVCSAPAARVDRGRRSPGAAPAPRVPRGRNGRRGGGGVLERLRGGARD